MDNKQIKLKKNTMLEHQKRNKPGECVKYITTIIDPELMNYEMSSLIAPSLKTLGANMEISPQIIPKVISWKRKIIDENISEVIEKTVTENHILYLMIAEELDVAIKNKELLNIFKTVKELYQRKSITLLVYGLKEYCRSNPKNNSGRLAFEINLTELQLFENICHRPLDTAADLGLAIMQYTKSIAEIYYKKEQLEKYADQNFYLMNDNKDCVHVKDSTGLSNLWQHHLIKLPLATLETAEAIINKYPTLKTLIDAYAKIDSTTGQNLLANIPIRRAAGPLTTVRKIGPELSRKVYELYNNKDPNYVI